MRRLRWLLIAAAPLILCAASGDSPGARWWSYVEFLASDKLEGRNTGSEGHRQAAEFAASEFERDGLKPAGGQGYIQPVKFRTLRLDESGSSLALLRGSKEQTLTLGEDAMISARVDPAPTVEADLVFVGYGLKVPEIRYDDFAGLDAKGKIAVYLAGAPSNLSGALAAHYQSGAERWRTFRAAGIIGAVSLANPKHMDIPWRRQAANRGQAAMVLAAGRNETEGEKIAVAWNPAHADELFEGTGHNLEELIALAEAGKPLPHFQIPARLRARTRVVRADVTSQNIAAVYPGADPALRNEYVVMSAHIDHLGMTDKPVNGDSVFNGAMDNAAGVATVLDTAAKLHEAKPRVRRSILFLIVTGEEKGLLGSKYFAESPTVPAKNIVADINTDMFLPLYPLKRITVYGLGESTLGDDVTAIAKEMGIEPQLDPDPERNSFIRSDQYSFILHGVPALAMKDGYVKGTPEEKIFKAWLTERYHAVSDDLNQPVDKGAAEKFDELAARLLERVANESARPSWKPDSFFRRYAAKN